MRAVVQRVKNAEVSVAGRTVGAIGQGLVVLLGVGHEDAETDADYLAEKIAGLRIFADESALGARTAARLAHLGETGERPPVSRDKMNLSVTDIRGEVMVISQFTLYGDVRRGKRPSFTDAAPPDRARALYEYFVQRLKSLGIRNVATGEFQAMMDVSLVNAGPVTILLDEPEDILRAREHVS